VIQRIDYSGDLTDRDSLMELLKTTGLGPAASRSKADLFAKAASQLARIDTTGHPNRAAALFVPGRIEVMGKHTDYAGGHSMVAAAERGFCLVVAPRDDSRIVVSDVGFGDTIEFSLDSELVPQPGQWSNYPMTVARRMVRNFPGAGRGANIAMGSDLPPAAGMSSSSAMIVAMFLALARVNDLWTRPEFRENVKDLVDLAGYLAVIENGQTFGTLDGDRGVGTFGGSEDHTAILCSRPDTVSQYSYCPLRFQRTLAMPRGYTFAVGASGVVAEKTGAAMEKYNQASRLAGRCAELWRTETGRDEPHLAAIVASSPGAAEQMRQIIRDSAVCAPDMPPDALLARFEHFHAENEELLPAVGRALAERDIEAFGRFADQSQRKAEQLLGNQIPETAYLARTARENGAAGANAFGAGFGGSVWALVKEARIDDFLTVWREAYLARFPQHAKTSLFFATGAGPAAFELV
jgi:galactokinase